MPRAHNLAQAAKTSTAKASASLETVAKAKTRISAKGKASVAEGKTRRRLTAEVLSRTISPGSFSSQTMQAYAYAPQERINIIRKGIPAAQVAHLAARMDTSKDWLIDRLRIPRATLNRRVREHKPLAQDESERVLGLATLIGQVETMLSESGAPEEFDVAKWLAQWIKQPLPALGGQAAAEYLDTVEGQKMIAQLLATAQSGAYA